MVSINKALGQVLAKYRTLTKLSQEKLADRAGIHRTYISQVERGLKSPTLSVLFRIAKSLNITTSVLIAEIEQVLNGVMINNKETMYTINSDFKIFCGFEVDDQQIKSALHQTNDFLQTIPSNVYKNLDYKITSSIVGSMFCQSIATATGAIVNPIEKGHPDVIPIKGKDASEEELRNYPEGLEVKCTVGNITKGANLRAGQPRIQSLEGITWQAHHQEVEQLLGLIWDFVSSEHEFNYPKVTGIFYTNNLTTDDWGSISGTEGRNTKVTGMKASGKEKMGQGWVALLNQPSYTKSYQKILKFSM
ncbi:MAG: helix-turn-helix transcriptional regulator [Jaaginema sp. PMC 1079.18]|nr:helix-turn-helix transcriptional regulator [Jaaginema sp. PMC 1080.18]MEC4850604.1 helix-turn-helix transcriptional regulator [Jaaginema sp. PMC 1079.18]MEC4867720.1 helix-turn-helix transcriptional regulator [Jaaginema sp. PMC 1078.18]